MAGKPWEKYSGQAPRGTGPWSRYQEPPPPDTSAVAPPEEETLAQKALRIAREQGPQAVGGQVGATLGTPFGPGGRVGGAMLGGAGGKAAGLVGEYLVGTRDPAEDTALGNARAIGMAGLAEGAGEGAFMGLGKLKPLGAKLGAGGAKIAASVPEKFGEAAFKDPGILSRALSPGEIGAEYEKFETQHGLKGLRTKLAEMNRATLSPATAEEMVMGAERSLAPRQPIPAEMPLQRPPDIQDLYQASQAASNLKLGAKLGEPNAQMAMASGSISKAKSAIDAALEKQVPGYADLRKKYFEAKVKAAFASPLPLNKGGTVNVLRPTVAASEAVTAAMLGHPLGAAGALAGLSPKAWGALIRLLPSLGKAGKAGARLAAGAAADTASEELP